MLLYGAIYMNVSYEEVTDNNAVLLRSLAPSNILFGIKEPGCHTVVARNTDSNEAVGIYQFMILKEKALLTWLYVNRSYRGMGLGKELLKNLCKQPKLYKLSTLECRLYEGYALNLDISSFSGYLLSSGFDDARDTEGPFVIPGKYMLTQCRDEKIKELERVAVGVFSFSRGTPDYIVESGTLLGITDEKELLEADRDISSICEKNGECHGILAMKLKGTVLSPSIFTAKDKDTKGKLFAATFLNMVENIRLKDTLVFESDEDINEWMKIYFPEIEQTKAVVLTKAF